MLDSSNNVNCTSITMIKLKTGELLIGRLKYVKSMVELYRPLIVMTVPCFSKDGDYEESRIFMKKWQECSDQFIFRFPRNMIMMEFKPSDDALEYYDKCILEDDQIYSDDELIDTLDELDSKNKLE